MKKMFVGILSFAMLVAGGFSLVKGSTYAEGSEMTIDDVVEAIAKNEDITLTNDITVTEAVDVSDLTSPYTGTFDGKGYKITNLSLVSSSGYMGLIPYAQGATIQNVKLDGTLSFDLSQLPVGTSYVGAIVGYGENVTIQTCEANLAATEDGETAISPLEISTNMKFGVLAGAINGNGKQFNVEDCVAYYDGKISIKKQTSLSVGGLVGEIKNASIVSCLNYGSLTYGGEALEKQENVWQYFGGIVGSLQGVSSSIRNCCFGGTLSPETGYSNQSLYLGTILGGCPSEYNEDNVKFDYYIQDATNPVGDGTIKSKTGLQRVSSIKDKDDNPIFSYIDKTFLQTVKLENGEYLFDSALKVWNFDSVWDYKNSKVTLQQFETFSFSLPTNFEMTSETKALNKDTTGIYLSAGEEGKVNIDKSVTKKFKETVKFIVNLKEESVGWFNNLSVYHNQDTLVQDAKVTIFNDEETGQVTGWTVEINANASTAGRYSFAVKQIPYNCEVAVLDSQTEYGDVRLKNSAGTDAITNLEFNHSIKVRTVEAVSQGVYAFECWEVFYKDGDSWSVNPATWEVGETYKPEQNNPTLEVHYGEKPFDIPFKLIAVFTPDPASVNFKFESKAVDNITLAGNEYEGGKIEVSKNMPATLRITTKKGYKLDASKLGNQVLNYLRANETGDVLPETFSNEPLVNADGTTTYIFNLDMRKLVKGENVDLNFTLTTIEEKGSAGKNNIWLYIAIPAAAVVVIGLVIFFIIRGRRGGKGGKGGSSKNNKTTAKPKAESYSDYYV
ncbi:MAG: hypothetical protein J6K97_03625 [Clostridia bacterium]|nr:hypothetical protein [Clostridia bacterium]